MIRSEEFYDKETIVKCFARYKIKSDFLKNMIDPSWEAYWVQIHLVSHH